MNITVHLFQWNLSIIGCRSFEARNLLILSRRGQTAATCAGCKLDDGVFYWCCSDVTPHHPISDLSTLERIVNNKHLPVSPRLQTVWCLMSQSLGRWQLVVRGPTSSGGVFQVFRGLIIVNFLKLWEVLRPLKTNLFVLRWWQLSVVGHRRRGQCLKDYLSNYYIPRMTFNSAYGL